MATTNIENGKTYTFKNVGSGKFLNLYAGNTVNGTNVCQYSEDGSDEQKWTRIGDKLCTFGSTSKCLDRYYVSGNAKCNNADIWDDNDDENQVLIFGISNGYVTIRLRYANGYYLRASTLAGTNSQMNSYGNTDAYKVPGATGNVYWSDDPLDAYSAWEAVEVVGDVEFGDVINKNTAGFSNINILTQWKNAETDNYGISHWNCTFYCWGRAYDVTGGTCLPMNKTAYKWYSEYTPNGTFTKRTAAQGPVDRCIAVLKKASGDDTGHVVFIEKVLENGEVYYSEANMPGYEDGVVRLATIIDGKYKMQRGSTVTSQPWYTANVLGYIVPVNQ